MVMNSRGITPHPVRTFDEQVIQARPANRRYSHHELPSRGADPSHPISPRVTLFSPGPPSPRLGRILVVEDDPSLCALYDGVLGASGYSVVATSTRAESLAAIAQLGGDVDLLIVDMNLPDADATDLTREISDRIGARPTLYVSSWAGEFLDLSQAPGRWRVMHLPLEATALLEAVDWLVRQDVATPTR